ncbi:hypothetical protein [Enterococcus olivae]
MNEPIKQAEQAIRDQEEIDVGVQQMAKMHADYFNTLRDNGLNEMTSTILTGVWLTAITNQSK